jgi:hypothetical protein
VRDAINSAPQPAAGRATQPADRIPGAPPADVPGTPWGFLFRPSGVVYVVSGDGMLHVLGLPSGKAMQRPAPFLPAGSKWSAPIAVDTTLYAATSGSCGGAPDGVWAIDLDSADEKRVVTWKTNGGPVVGAVAFTSDGTLIAAIGAGQTTGDGKANAMVALDRHTLQVKDWFTQPSAEFVTGPTVLRHNGKELIAAATKDGRVLVLDAASLGGADHATPLLASKPVTAGGGGISGEALSAWQSGSPAAPASPAATASWILLPVSGRPAPGVPSTNGAVTAGTVIALKLTGTSGPLALEPAWVSHDLAAPAPPLVVNGVVFTLATGRPSSESGPGRPAVLHAYDGATGKRLWESGTALSTFASPGSLWSGLGQIYVGTQDGTLHAFGFDDERSHTSTAPAR